MNSVERTEDFAFQVTFGVPLLPVSVNGNSIADVLPFTRKSCYFFPSLPSTVSAPPPQTSDPSLEL